MGNDPSKNMIFWFFLALFTLSIVLLGWLLMPFFSILIMASVVAWAFYPVHAFITVKNTINPPFAAVFTCIQIFFILFIPIIFFGGVLSREAYSLYLMGKSAVISGQIQSILESSNVDGALEKANLVLANVNLNVTVDDLNTGIMDLGKFIGKLLFDQLKAITSNVLNFVVNFFFMLLVVFFLLLDGKKLLRFIMDLSPLPQDQDEILLLKFRDMAGAIIIGNGLAGAIQGVAGGIVFAVFGIASPYLWGLLMGLLAFLPIVGIGGVFLPAALYLFLTGRAGAGIFFIVFYAILSGSVEYLVKPKIMGDRVKIHTLLVFLAIIGGLKMFGILGIVYGPLIVTAFLTLVDIYHANYQRIVEPY
jgi:predicted PurR-regulated permease PerM